MVHRMVMKIAFDDLENHVDYWTRLQMKHDFSANHINFTNTIKIPTEETLHAQQNISFGRLW